jgi:predicted ATP-binding protein involved in virulence
MNIKQLKLSNFKKFEELEVEFNDGVNLFVGVNSSGKTTILEAVNIAVGAFFGSQEPKMQQLINFEDIKIKEGKRAESASVEASSTYINGSWKRTIRRDTKKNYNKEIKNPRDYGAVFFKAFEKEDDKTVAPIIAYYSTQRLFSDAKQSKYQQYDSTLGRKNGYIETLKVQAIKSLLHEWLFNATIRKYTRASENLVLNDIVLTNVRAAIKNILATFWKIGSDEEVKIYFDPDYGKIPFLAYGDLDNIPFTSLSDGLRNLLYLVIDLVWRASQLNPFLNLDQISAQVNGVVTIDEIDLHLHPRWQALIIKQLQILFPKVQFFITTHSPIVVGNFENGTLYTINDGEVAKYEGHYFGLSADDIITNILEAAPRNKGVEKKIEELFLLIDSGNKEKYVPLLAELTALLGKYDKNILRAESLIEWNETPE